ncbi:MAG: hypothetical protein AAF711_17785 [Planctomycetota bacterium]
MEPPSRSQIKLILESEDDLASLRGYLLDWKSKGLAQEQCYEAFMDFLEQEQLSELMDDLLREWMDLVSGFCSAHMQVW